MGISLLTLKNVRESIVGGVVVLQVMEVRLMQLEKASSPIVVTLSGMVMAMRLLQP